MRILVLGGSGSLGTDLCPLLASRHEVFAPPHRDVDVLSSDSVRRALDASRADAVVNCAALADVDRCEREPEAAWQLNADAVRYIAGAAAERGVSLLHVSTDYVFDGEKGAPYVESDRTNPIQVYGKSKLQGERNALDIAGRATVVRTSWLFSRSGKGKFANAVLAAGRNGGDVKAVRDWFGSPTSTVDLSDVMMRLLEAGATGVFHVANPGAQSRLEQANEILNALGPHKANVIAVSSASLLGLSAARPRDTALASERLGALGISLRPRAEAVREFVGV